MNEESRLRERFDDLREELGKRTPSFRSIIERQPSRVASRLPIAAAVFLMLVLAIGVAGRQSRVPFPRPVYSARLPAEARRAASHITTEFLLITPSPQA